MFEFLSTMLNKTEIFLDMTPFRWVQQCRGRNMPKKLNLQCRTYTRGGRSRLV